MKKISFSFLLIFLILSACSKSKLLTKKDFNKAMNFMVSDSIYLQQTLKHDNDLILANSKYFGFDIVGNNIHNRRLGFHFKNSNEKNSNTIVFFSEIRLNSFKCIVVYTEYKWPCCFCPSCPLSGNNYPKANFIIYDFSKKDGDIILLDKGLWVQ